MGLKPRQVGLSMEDFEDFPDEQKPAFEKMVLLLNPFIADTAGALSGRLTLGDNVSASYKTIRCTIPGNTYFPITLTQPPTIATAWVPYGAPYATPGYRITMDGLVYLSGVVKDGTTGSGNIMFTLPEGYRPSATRVFALSKAGGAGVWELEIGANGDAVIGPRNADATWSSLDNVTFAAEGKAAAIPAFSGVGWPLVFNPQLETRPSAVFVAQVRDVDGNSTTSMGVAGVDWEIGDGNTIRIKQIHGLSPGRTYDVTFLTLGV